MSWDTPIEAIAPLARQSANRLFHRNRYLGRGAGGYDQHVGFILADLEPPAKFLRLCISLETEPPSELPFHHNRRRDVDVQRGQQRHAVSGAQELASPQMVARSRLAGKETGRRYEDEGPIRRIDEPSRQAEVLGSIEFVAFGSNEPADFGNTGAELKIEIN